MATKIKFTLTPYAGNKASYQPITSHYDTIIDCFGGSLGGTLQTAIANPEANYLVAEASNCQRALINALTKDQGYFLAVLTEANFLIGEFFRQSNYTIAANWLSSQYQRSDNINLTNAALSVLRRFFFSSILRTTPGTGAINVWISVRKILGDKRWKEACVYYFPDIDYKALDTAQTKKFNAELGQLLFESDTLKQAMIRSVESWYKSIQPLLGEWFAYKQKMTVVDDYRKLLDLANVQGKTLLYIDPPYYNPNTGAFIDEAGRKRYHKQTPSYENHDPRSEATWFMFANCVDFGFDSGADMVLCNYVSDRFTSTLKNLTQYYDLEIVVTDKELQCTGQRSKYTNVPIGTETVIYCKRKVA